MISVEERKMLFQAIDDARAAVEKEIAEDRRGFFNALTALEAMETTVRNRLGAAINVIESDYDE